MHVSPKPPFNVSSMEAWNHSLTHLTESFALKMLLCHVSGPSSSVIHMVDNQFNVGQSGLARKALAIVLLTPTKAML